MRDARHMKDHVVGAEVPLPPGVSVHIESVDLEVIRVMFTGPGLEGRPNVGVRTGDEDLFAGSPVHGERPFEAVVLEARLPGAVHAALHHAAGAEHPEERAEEAAKVQQKGGKCPLLHGRNVIAV